MPNMPDKPDTWAVALAWLSQHAPILYAAGLSCVMAVLRITYGGGTGRQMLIEGAICGGLSLTIVRLFALWFIYLGRVDRSASWWQCNCSISAA